MCVFVYVCMYTELAHEHFYIGGYWMSVQRLAVIWVFTLPQHNLLWLPASIFIPLHHLLLDSTKAGSCMCVCTHTHSLDLNTCCPFVWDWRKTPITLVDKLQCSESENPLLVGSDCSSAIHSFFHLPNPLLPHLGAYWNLSQLSSGEDYCRATQWDR